MKSTVKATEKSIGFGTAIISTFVILILATAGLIGFISFRNGQEAAEKLADQTRKAIQARVAHDLNLFLEKPHALNRINADTIQSGLIAPRDLAVLRHRFLSQIQAFDSVMTCAFGSEAGDFTSAGRRSAGGFDCAIADKRQDDDYRVYLLDEQGDPSELIAVVENYRPQSRTWYKVALDADGPAWSPIYVWASQSNIGISAVRPVQDKTGRLAGVQLSALSLGHIGRFLQHIQTNNNGRIFIVERSGLLVASSTATPLLIDSPTESEARPTRVAAENSADAVIQKAAACIREKRGGFDGISKNERMDIAVAERRFFLGATPFSDPYGLDWVIVVAIPEADLMGPVKANIRATIWTGAVILSVTLMLGIAITRITTQPLLQLNGSARQMRHGNWETIEIRTRFKEIRQLTDAYNQMAGQLRETFRTLEKRVQARTAELADANAQLQLEVAARKKTEIDRERLISELQQALEKVKLLSGLLPICANCKKIRDDSDRWHDVAAYVSDHSEADFSHGICPECMTKLYPDLLDDDK